MDIKLLTKKVFEDKTLEWLSNSKPNSHKLIISEYFEKDGVKYFVDGKNVIYDFTKNETMIAVWLEETFGGKIFILPKVNFPKNIQTPDFLFRGECWDLKNVTGNGKHTLDSNVKKKKNQSPNFIFDISNSDMSIEEAIKQIKLIFESKERIWLQKIILRKNNIVKVYIRNY